LSARLYRQSGQKAEYVRQAGFTPIQQQQMLLSYVAAHGRIRRSEVMDLCHLNENQAYRLLKQLVDSGKILKTGERRYASYTRPT
jgi:ATP-dependent DNA helicase RecG